MHVPAFSSVGKCLPNIAVSERTSRITKKTDKAKEISSKHQAVMDELRLDPSVPDALLATVVEAAGIRVLDTPPIPVADIAG
jgi:hypothetical protein